MDNNELDKILKSKLKDKIKPSAELEGKIRQKVEQEKVNQLKSMNPDNNNKNKNKKYKRIRTIISMAAVILIVFAVGVNLDTIPNILQPTTVEVANIKAVEPTKTLNGILASDSDFIIYADDTNVESVQKSLYVEPALEYTIKKESDNSYKLTFKQNIPDNTIVKLQYVKNKITEDSWAYQTSNKLSVSSTHPYNKETYVSKNTTIEIKFSYASVEDLKSNVEISPKVEGKWEHLGKIWRFTPKKALKENQKYTIKINKGIKAEDQILEEDYIFTFTVDTSGNEIKYTHNKTSIDGIENAKSNELVKIHYNTDEYTSSTTKISKVEISKFNNSNEFIQYIETNNHENAKTLGKYEFKQEQNYLQLTKTLPTGYYVAIVKDQNNKEIFNCPVQVNDLAAYAIQTERDIIAWVAEGNDLAKDVKVEYLGKEEKTNSQGIAEFKGILDGTETIKYLKIGNNENKLVVGIYNYEQENYPSGYIYTDRPLYKNTDTINIWGFVPRGFFYDKIDEDGFYIQMGNEEKQKVKIDETGSFTHKIELKNHVDNEYIYITLYYKDKHIASRNLAIENYELQNYTYNVIMDKDYGYIGEKFEFEVKVEHITGLSVPNKSVVAEYNDEIYRATTNENGIAKFSFKLEEDDEDTTITANREIAIYNGDLEEYTGSEIYTNVTVLCRNTYTDVEDQDESKKYKLTLYKLSANKDATVSYDLHEIYEGKYNTEVKVNLVEEVEKRYISGYNYNEYTKENEPEYSYETIDENNTLIETIKTQDGVVEFDANKLNLKKDTEEINYFYHLEFIYNDGNNKQVKERFYIDNGDEYESNTLGFSTGWEYSSCGIGDVPTDIDYDSYDVFRYFFKQDTYNFNIGDTVKLTLAESTENGATDITNQGKILRLVLQEDITKKEIIEDNNFNYTFTDKDFPGCGITTAYFINGKFYRMPTYYFDFKTEERETKVEITADKQEYKPGDKVTLTVKTTNKGNPIKSTVNVSVINKAVFELQEDFTEILYDIYNNKYYNVYTYSTYKDFINDMAGGGGGGDGEVRGDFGDTACFETVTTNSKGIAKVEFTLPDNVTTYTATAHSANKDLYVGVNTLDIVSKLDFFIQSTEPRNVKTTDDLVLNATSIAEEKYNVQYEFTIKELNKTLKAEANSNSIATVNFGKLDYGTYHVTIRGKHENYQDAIEYEFNVVESAQEVKDKKTVKINEDTTIKPSKNPIVLEIYNKDMEQYVKYIEFIEETLEERLDTQIAYNQVQGIKEKYYNTQSSTNYIDIEKYEGENSFKNLSNGKDDLVLTALISKYAKEYYGSADIYEKESLDKNDNIFEIYLLSAANNEPVLTDLLYLKEEKDISNYNKLLVTLSLEFLGDYQNAEELYNSIELKKSEAKEYKSIIALIETYINKQEAVTKINELIKNTPADEYLRFAILSFFENNSIEIEKEEQVKIVSENINETITINGMEVKTYTINNDDLDTIKFETDSKDLMVSYYYQTLLDEVESKNISKDMKIKLNGKLQKGNTVTLSIEFNKNIEGEVKIALPNSLRLAQNDGDYDYSKYYLMNNQIDYVTFYKSKKCTKMEIPLLVIYEGEYKFENVVCTADGKYYISNSLDLDISK